MSGAPSFRNSTDRLLTDSFSFRRRKVRVSSRRRLLLRGVIAVYLYLYLSEEAQFLVAADATGAVEAEWSAAGARAEAWVAAAAESDGSDARAAEWEPQAFAEAAEAAAFLCRLAAVQVFPAEVLLPDDSRALDEQARVFPHG
jgi:hypothetical protein